jgi:FkbM family methyltransferase
MTQATLLALVEVAPKPNVFLDVGAHIGVYSALIKTVFGEPTKVLAFEPTPQTATIARRLAKVNGLSYDVVELALSSAPGEATLYLSDKAETSNSLSEGFRSSSQQVSVSVSTLDDFCLEKEVAPSVLKVDVETFEPHVLRGGVLTLAKHRPRIVFEMLPRSDARMTDSVLTLLASAGYQLYRSAHGAWVRTPLGSYRAHLSHDERDWLLSVDELPDELAPAIARWLDAIAECSEETNVLVPGGTPPPSGWNAPYIEASGGQAR